jgi:mannose-6-phosphate isomerase-like protein (cupin superfamily)
MLVEKLRGGLILGSDAERIFGIWDTTLQQGQRVEPHFHERFEEVYYILSGRGRIYIEDEEEEVERGDVVYIPKKKVHTLENPAEEPLRFITLTVSVEDLGEAPPYIA